MLSITHCYITIFVLVASEYLIFQSFSRYLSPFDDHKQYFAMIPLHERGSREKFSEICADDEFILVKASNFTSAESFISRVRGAKRKC